MNELIRSVCSFFRCMFFLQNKWIKIFIVCPRKQYGFFLPLPTFLSDVVKFYKLTFWSARQTCCNTYFMALRQNKEIILFLNLCDATRCSSYWLGAPRSICMHIPTCQTNSLPGRHSLRLDVFSKGCWNTGYSHWDDQSISIYKLFMIPHWVT